MIYKEKRAIFVPEIEFNTNLPTIMKLKLFFTSLAGAALLVLGACSNEESFFTESGTKTLSPQDESTAPVVRTDPVLTNVASGTATVTGYVDSDGGSRIKLRGFVYSDTTSTPTFQTGKRILILTGDFTRAITGLKDGVEYYVRAYAVNQTDTAYGNAIKMVTACTPSSVITLPVVNRVKRAAIVCGQFVEEGETESYGVCLSRLPNPTIEDTYLKAPDVDRTDVIGCFGVLFDNLEPQTMYHVRACAVQKDGTVVYGNDRIFQTTKGGNVTSYFWNGDDCKKQDPAAYDRIKQAIDSALYYYNNYSNLDKHINYNYSPGTPTADCNIEGWMRFGENERYQWVGTAQHEISHAMGVGTASNWSSLIKIGSGNTWSRPKATQALRVVMRDMTMKINGDGMHFWPGGINQREEVTTGTANSKNEYIRNADMLKGNALILNGMREDGMTNY